MERERFHYLYVNANGLAEFGLLSAILGMETTDGEGPASPPPDAAPDFSGLDFSALDGIDFSFGGGEGNRGADPPPPFPAPDAEAECADPGIYLERVYALEAELAPRVDSAFGKADAVEIAGLLASLPGHLAPLTARLDGPEFAAWLGLYRSEHEALRELIARIRRLDA